MSAWSRLDLAVVSVAGAPICNRCFARVQSSAGVWCPTFRKRRNGPTGWSRSVFPSRILIPNALLVPILAWYWFQTGQMTAQLHLHLRHDLSQGPILHFFLNTNGFFAIPIYSKRRWHFLFKHSRQEEMNYPELRQTHGLDTGVKFLTQLPHRAFSP